LRLRVVHIRIIENPHGKDAVALGAVGSAAEVLGVGGASVVAVGALVSDLLGHRFSFRAKW
jgi:hypothetical protein